jgi:PhnB protein
MNIETYLHFPGTCEAALSFYTKALGAEVVAMMRYKENPDTMPPEFDAGAIAERIMHSLVRIGETTIMAGDWPDTQEHKLEGFSLTINPKDVEEGTRLFNALAEGGTVKMPLGKTFWSPCFGMLDDKFGVSWMVNVAPDTCADTDQS